MNATHRFTLKEELALAVTPLLVEDVLKTCRADEEGIEAMIGKAAVNIANVVIDQLERDEA